MWLLFGQRHCEPWCDGRLKKSRNVCKVERHLLSSKKVETASVGVIAHAFSLFFCLWHDLSSYFQLHWRWPNTKAYFKTLHLNKHIFVSTSTSCSHKRLSGFASSFDRKVWRQTSTLITRACNIEFYKNRNKSYQLECKACMSTINGVNVVHTCQLTRDDKFSTIKRYSVRSGGP